MKKCCKNCKHIIVSGGIGMCFCEESPFWHYEMLSYESCDAYEKIARKKFIKSTKNQK